MLKKTANRWKKFTMGYYNLLLFFIIILFIFRPYNRSELYTAAWIFLLAATILASIFNCHHHRYVKWAAVILAIPTVTFSWLNLMHPHEYEFIGNAVCTILFMTLCATSILYDVVLRAHVTLEIDDVFELDDPERLCPFRDH